MPQIEPWDVLAIPSRARPDMLVQRTLPALASAGCALRAVDVWVHESERDAYARALRPFGSGVRLRPYAVDPPYCLRDARNLIAEAYPAGTRLLQADDDLCEFLEFVPPSRFVRADLAAELRYGWQLLERTGLSLFGVFPLPKTVFVSRSVTTRFTYINGCLFGVLVRREPYELVSLDDKEDFERSARHFLARGGVVRLNYIAIKTQYYSAPGGMQVYRTPDTVRAGAERLHAMFPQLFFPPAQRKSSGSWECRVRITPGERFPPRREPC